MVHRRRHGNGRMRHHTQSSPILVSILLTVLSCLHLPHEVAGNASDFLLSGQYKPTTNIDHIIELTELIEAIESNTNGLDEAEKFYKQETEGNLISLEQISNSNDINYSYNNPSHYLDQSVNPLHGVTMYALWRSTHGNGKGGTDVARESMKFFSQPIDFYPHTIIMAEFDKSSGYNADVTAQTIRVTSMWMATVQSLYNGVDVCKKKPDATDDPNWRNPIDMAAAFWIGTQEEITSVGGGSLYAWAKDIGSKFTGQPDANAKIVEGLNNLQTLLQNCLLPSVPASDRDTNTQKMRVIADDIVRWMTVPLTQSLIWHSTDLGDANKRDFVVLYGLMTLPQIIVCDDKAFSDLYDAYVVNVKNEVDSDALLSAKKQLESRYTCLGIDCSMVGNASFLSGDVCKDSELNIHGYIGSSQELNEVAMVDLDVRTIGTLVEMNADTAAHDIYHWGRFSKSGSDGGYYPLQKYALGTAHPSNAVAAAFVNQFGQTHPSDNIVDNAINGTGAFQSLLSSTRRVIAEASMVTVLLHIYAIDSMYEAIDKCSIEPWDRAVAALTGWAEGTDNAKGLLFMSIGRYLCSRHATCEVANAASPDHGQDAKVNKLIMLEFKSGRDAINEGLCAEAKGHITKIETLILTELVDATAYFAQQVVANPSNSDNEADLYAIAWALIPLITDTNAQQTIRNNVGLSVNSLSQQMVDQVLAALKKVVTEANIDCKLLDSAICGSESLSPQTGSDVSSALDSGVSSQALLSYVPSTNVDSIIQLTSDIESIQQQSNKDASYKIYDKDGAVSLKQIATNQYFSSSSRKHNPLYSHYMYSLWKSADGGNAVGNPQDKEFDDEPVEFFGNSIVEDEYNKPSGYDPELTSETMRVVIMWMATVQSIYESVQFCSETTATSSPDRVNPIDKAAALWVGNAPFIMTTFGGSLLAWTNRMHDQFGAPSFNANNQILDNLSQLQSDLDLCLQASTSAETKEQIIGRMWSVSKDTTTAMTVPLVQNLLYSLAIEANKDTIPGPHGEDTLVLYSLMTLPPLWVCDEDGFKRLYKNIVSEKASLDSNLVKDAVSTLQNNYACLGISCDQVGNLKSPELLLQGSSSCQESTQLKIAGYDGVSAQTMKVAQVDIDIRSIGMLLEIESYDAAASVYKYGGIFKDSNLGFNSIQSLASSPAKSSKGADLREQYSATAASHIVDEALNENSFMMKDATSIQRKVLAEATIVAITLHIYAIDSLFKAVELCDVDASTAATSWDNAVAALVGWMEGPEDGGSSTNGVLFYNIAQYLCDEAEKCNMNNDSEVNRLMIRHLKEGKQHLNSRECVAADTSAIEVEKLLQTVLADTNAYFAEQIAEDKLNTEALAEGYIFAKALAPIMQSVDADASNVVLENLGDFPTDNPMKDGIATVLAALNSFVTKEGIDCKLLTTPICSNTANTVPIGPDNNGFLPGTGTTNVNSPSENQNVASGLLGNAYKNTTNVDHIIELTDRITMIANAGTTDVARAYYTQYEDGISLQTLSTGLLWEDISETNPLYVLYMYGFWNSEMGESDGDGYSNKMFDDNPLLPFGDTIVTDELEKESGFDSKLSAEAILLTNMWMAMTNYLYGAVESCRDGSIRNQDYNDIDIAAAFWFGSQTDPNSTTESSLFAWANRAQSEFIGFSTGVNDEMIRMLSSLQKSYSSCKTADSDRKNIAISMKYDVDYTIQVMTVPLMQNFIQILASMSGIGNQVQNDRSNYLVLYSLMVLPLISICDESTFDLLWDQLIGSKPQSYTSSTFVDILKTVQDRYQCLGISCDLVGRSSLNGGVGWPVCDDNAANRMELAGYKPATEGSQNWSLIDLDISTILSFIVMEATPLANDIYDNGRNVDDTNSKMYVSIDSISTPSTTDVQNIWQSYESESSINGYSPSSVTKNAIKGTAEFESTAPLKKSAAASLALATIDMHIAILDNMYQAQNACAAKQAQQTSMYWDRAAAVTIGWSEGPIDGGSDTDGHLLFQIAQELCDRFDSCEENGSSKINTLLMDEFRNGLQYAKTFQCDRLKTSTGTIETLLQAILVDNLAFHTQFAESDWDEMHCLLAYISANAIVPFVRAVDADSANMIEQKIRVTSSPAKCFVEDRDAIYSSLKKFVVASAIDCDLLGSQVCGLAVGTNPIDSVQNSVYTSNNSGHAVANGEYVPDVNVENLSQLKTVIQGICSAADGTEAKKFYEDEDTIGVSIKSMSTFGKYVMADELLFNQYVYALYDDVDKTDGSFLFDGEPASEYAHTIVSDAFDGNFISIGCTAVKILHVWMWTVHKTYEASKQCDIEIPDNYGAIDEAAALWEGGMLFDLAETLGPKFGHDEMNGMTYLNRQIIDRFNSAQSYFQDNVNSCQSKNALGGLRIIIKEIVSYMTAVLIQHLIDAMVDSDSRPENMEEDMVELASFAVLPLIMTCGHEMVYDDLYNKLSTRNFDKSDIPSVTDAIHSHLNCLGLSCDDIGKHTSGYGITWYPECSDNLDIVGYIPINPTPTNMIAKLDLDAVAIDQMMQLEKYKIATDIYMNGHNYYDYEKEDIGFVSIYDMTQSATIGYTSFPQYELYGGYFVRKGLGNSPGEFAHNIFVDATTPNGRFATATAEQRRSVVEITISSFVSYFSSLEALYYAAFSCPTNKDSAAKAYDGGVAFLVGSVEGTEKGGNADEEGRFFYNLAKMACSYFDDCVEGGDAEINKLMLNTLTSGQTSLKNSDCTGLSEAVDKFASQTVVPLMQSLLTFAETIDNEPDGEVASMSIAPIVSDFDQTLSDKIVSTMAYGTDTGDDSVAKKNDVYNAINTVLANANFEDIACDVIPSLCSSDGGTSTLGNITPDKPEPIKPKEPTPISGGLYISTTYIGDKSAIALDVKEIEERLQVQDIDRATFIYEEGMNSKIYDVNGMPTSKERSIQDFSLNSGRVMLRDPTYNLFINGLSDDFNEFYGKPVVDYADSYVSTLLYSASKNAGDAMVAIPIWMEVAHSLHSAYEACRTSVLSEDRSIDGRELVEAEVAARFIDEAAAYWIGDGQSTGSSDRGHLLYALSETISEEYGETASSQSSMNTRIIDLLQQAKNHVAISRSCTTSSDSHLKLRSVIEEMIPIMAVPLLRSLLHAMKRDDIERVQMFAVAVLPLFAKCNPATYLELKNDLIDNTLLSTQKNYVYSKIVTLYDCLGLSCDLIGNLSGDGFAYQCEDSSKVKSLAGYSYVADGDVISSAAKIDIEIRLMEIYINNGMVHFPDDVEALFGLAYERYRFGNGSLRGEGSISRLAKDVRRDIVPSFPQFRRYFKSDENYADNIIVDAFEKASIFNGADADYRKRVILFTSKYMVTHMAILQNLYSAINSCKEGNANQGVMNLDTAAAYYTGSLEGVEDGGSYEGSLSFFLARRMCIYFDTCSQSDNAMINERVISLFYAAQGELDTKACVPLERTVKDIDNALLIPLIQGTLFAAWQNSYYFTNNILIPTTQEFLPEGYVLAQSVLPIVANVDSSAAKDIASVMVDEFPNYTSEKASNYVTVFSAMKRALSKMDGIDCKQIGTIGGQGFCPGDADPNHSYRLALSAIVILPMSGLLWLLF